MRWTLKKDPTQPDSKAPGRFQPNVKRPGAAKDAEKAKMPPSKTWLWFVGALLANYLLVRLIFPPEAPVTVPYTLFKEEVGKGNVAAIYSQGETITGRFAKPVMYPPAEEKAGTPGTEPKTTDEKTSPIKDKLKTIGATR